VQRVVILGGGDGSRDLHKLDRTGKITTMKNAPFDIGISSGILTCDPVTGDFLFLNRDSLYVLNLASETWSGVTKNPYMVPDFTSHYVVGVTMDTLGVVAFLSTYTWPVLLYKHADKPAALESSSAAHSEASIACFPNPFTVRTTFNVPGNAELRIFNLQGKLVSDLSKNISGRQAVWESRGLPAGMYIAKMRREGVVSQKTLFLVK
jgi:hypothetical protein